MTHLNNLLGQISHLDNNICIINGALNDIHEIESLGWKGYWLKSKENLPRYLYKYYADTITDGHNYTRENFENNTVYMQNPVKFNDIYDCDIYIDKDDYVYSRLKELCSRAGIIEANYDKEKLILMLNEKLYIALKETGDISNAFINNINEISSITIKLFCIDLKKDYLTV